MKCRVESKMGSRLALALLLAVPCLLTLARCSAGQSQSAGAQGKAACGAEPAAITAQREQDYATTVYPLLLQSHCNNCHDGQSGLAPYPHSSASLDQAYGAAIQLVNLSNPSASTFVSQINSNHNCGSAAECQTLSQELVTEIGAWAAAESTLPPPPTCAGNLTTGLTVALPGQAIAAQSLSPTSPMTLRWDMSAINSTLGQMTFSVDLVSFTAPSTNGNGSYLIQNPILATADLRVKVVGLLPVINGTVSTQYADFSGLDFVVAQQSYDPTATILGFAPISNDAQQVDWLNPTSGDSLGFSIIVQQTSDDPSTTTLAPGCKDNPPNGDFQKVYDNVFNLQIPNGSGGYIGQCTQCHGSSTAAAEAVMNLSGNGADPCLQVLMRVNLKDAMSSLLLQKPSHLDASASQNAGSAHPVLIPLLSNLTTVNPAYLQQVQLILTWIKGECTANFGASECN